MANKIKEKISEIFNTAILILLILFSLFIIYQILKKIFGGSWASEGIILTLLILIIGFLFSQAKTLGRLESEVGNIKNSFFHLATDFKNLIHDFKEHATKKKH